MHIKKAMLISNLIFFSKDISNVHIAKVEYLNEQHQKVRKTIDLLLQRGSPYEQWQIDLKHVMSAIE